MSEFAIATKQWDAKTIRQTFIDYFVEKRGHTFWKSSPVVPINDPTLLFANAGMNQFKPLFLGTCDPTLEMNNLKMAVNSQKCIRAGGKHNDLEDVGKDVYHHTFFEMLGNWSFGAYFKEDAITWAFECLTVVYGIDANRLYATYFGGDEKQGLAPDEEARAIWLRFLPADRILPFGCKDNFWEMGATGPCGPCTEIHFDRIGGRDASALVNADRPDVIEIWNNVFIQFNRDTDGTLKDLPAKHVDTGMGFERLSSILQGKDSNYDTDIFMPIFKAIESISGCRPYSGLVGADDKDLKDMAYRVVADHIRTLTFAITDGALPSNDGRGYVLRRILRRAVRYGQEILGAPNGFFTTLVTVVVDNFSDFFPELLARKDFVMRVISEEELSFTRTLDSGVKHLKKVVLSLKNAGSSIVPGKDAHLLFTSMGFPLDLTELMAAEQGFTVDKVEFEALMDNDRKISEAAEAARKGTGSADFTMEAEQTAWLANQGVAVTDSSSKYTWNIEHNAKIVALYLGRGQGDGPGFTESVTVFNGTVGIVVDSTSFYYESGGQTYDTGKIVSIGKNFEFKVESTQAYAGYIVHVGSFTTDSGKLSVNDEVTMLTDYNRRGYIAPNHTMTHVLNNALRSTLISEEDAANMVGQCEQKGSLVDTEKLRFDFSWNGPLTATQVEEVEKKVNAVISNQLQVYSDVVPLASASTITSLRMVFGERYPDPVRIISVGQSIDTLLADPTNRDWRNYSIEFCGGTHLTNSIDAVDFVIIEESGIAKGIRRIVGLTRDLAKKAKDTAASLLERLSQLELQPGSSELVSQLKSIKSEVDRATVSLTQKDQMKKKLDNIYEIIKAWSKAIMAVKVTAAIQQAETMAKEAISSKSEYIISHFDIGCDSKVVKKIQEAIKSIDASLSVFIVSKDDDNEKLGLYTAVSASHVAGGLSAKLWNDAAIAAVGSGKGGGKPDSANAFIPYSATTTADTLVSIVLAAASKYMNE